MAGLGGVPEASASSLVALATSGAGGSQTAVMAGLGGVPEALASSLVALATSGAGGSQERASTAFSISIFYGADALAEMFG